MKKERDTLARELLTDKANLAKIDARINAKQEQTEKISQMANFLEEKMDAYDTLINESEEAYTKVILDDKITENAGRLVTVLHEQCDRIESKMMTPNMNAAGSVHN